MRPGFKKIAGTAAIVPALFALALISSAALGDEPSRLGRFFRFGQNTAPLPAQTDESPVEVRSNPPRTIEPLPAASNSPQPRIMPQPRVTRAVTEADPIVTRISLARSDDGHSFGLFMQVYADGTVIDTDGVHSLGRQGIKGVLQALESGELYRIKGHCGSPSTDFVEQVQMVVYERSLRGLRANSFSFSGNTQGCDHAVQHLQKALEEIQMKLGRVAASTNPPASSTTPEPLQPSAPILLNAEPAGNP